MNKKILIILCLILFIVSVAGVSAAEDVNQTVDNTLSVSTIDNADQNDALSLFENVEELSAKDDGTFTALQKKIDDAPEGSTINLVNDYKYDSEFSTYGIEINKQLTINGNGHVIDANKQSRIFYIDGADNNVVLNDIKFYNAYYKYYGGAIWSTSCLEINNCTFYNNTASECYPGGAIYCSNDLKVKNSKFNRNHAEKGKYVIWIIGVYTNGGAIYCGGNADIENCYFSYNDAEHRGGAIYCPNFNIKNCTFKGNKAITDHYKSGDGEGGALAGSGYVDSCIFLDNYAKVRGDAISSNGWIDVNNSIFINWRESSSISSDKDQISLSWFGNTAENYAKNPNVRVENKLTHWLFLNATVTPINNKKSSVVYNFYLYDNITKTIRPADDINLPKIYFILSAINGTLDKNVTSIGEEVIFTTTNYKDGVLTAKDGLVDDITFSIVLPFVSSVNLDVPDVTKNYGGPERLEITLTESGSPIANTDVNININGIDYIRTTDSNGRAFLDLNLNAGNYDATVTYQNISVVSKVIINQLATTTSISYNKNSRNSVTLTALINPATAGGNVVFTVNGKDYTPDKINNGKATRTLNNLAAGNYEAKATYQGDVNHKSSASSSVKFTVDEVNIELKVPDVTKNYGGPEKLEITLTEDGSPIANADVNININGTHYGKTTDSNGKASMNIDLNAGIYDAIVTYQTVSKTAKITVKQLSTKTTLDYTTNSQYSVTLTALIDPATAGGNVVFTVNGKDYAADKVNNGKATRTLSNLDVGNYEAKATYQGDINHKYSLSNSVKFTVKDVKVDISAPDLTKYYHGPERFVVTVKEDNKPVVGKNVTINLNNVPYNRTTDANGQASMAINLNSGTYNVTSEYDGIKVKSTITVKPTIQGKDITKIYKNGTQYYATFVDTNGNLMKNTDITFNINGVFYTRKTNDQGVAKMNINLPPGTYIITAENPNSKEKYTNVIKVLPSIVENYDLTKYYKNASKYTLRIIGDDGKPVGEGVTVKLNINGVFYERKTNATGYMNMNINLPPGTYTVTAEYNGLRASNKITVLSVLETKDLVMKYKDGSKFEAKVLDGQGKPYAGQTATFNINGVFYTKTTETDGIARLKINLLAGEYIITSMYNGLNAANKVTISG